MFILNPANKYGNLFEWHIVVIQACTNHNLGIYSVNCKMPHNRINQMLQVAYQIHLFLDLFQENPACTKNNNSDKLLLTSLADQIENNRVRESNYWTQARDQESKKMLLKTFSYGDKSD